MEGGTDNANIDDAFLHQSAISLKNAIEEMAYKICRLREITNLSEGITVSVGTIKGGTVSNSIPGSCRIEIDARLIKPSQMEKLEHDLYAALDETHIPGTQTTNTVLSIINAFETTNSVKKLFDFCSQALQDCGEEPLKSTVLGGNSDAAYINIAGTPVICSCGVIGQGNHTGKEFAIVATMAERAKMLLSILSRLSTKVFYTSIQTFDGNSRNQRDCFRSILHQF